MSNTYLGSKIVGLLRERPMSVHELRQALSAAGEKPHSYAKVQKTARMVASPRRAKIKTTGHRVTFTVRYFLDSDQ